MSKKLEKYLNLARVEGITADFLTKILIFAVIFGWLFSLIINRGVFANLSFENISKPAEILLIQKKSNSIDFNKESEKVISENEYKYFLDQRLGGKCDEDLKEQKCSELCGADTKIVKDEEPPKPKPKPTSYVRPRTSAPMPHSYKKDSLGRLVCNKKNDKPGKSDKNKKKHMDMECCLDPDEWPNPNCYYGASKY